MTQFNPQGDMYGDSGMQGAQKRGMSTGVKVAIGCGGAVILCILLCAGFFGWAGYRWSSAGKAIRQSFLDQGYTLQEITSQQQTQPITGKIVYEGGQMDVTGGAQTDVAFLVKVCSLSGEFKGKVSFTGVTLDVNSGAILDKGLEIRDAVFPIVGKHGALIVTIHKGAVIKGDLDLGTITQVTIEDGATIEGQIKGTWRVMDDQRTNKPANQQPANGGNSPQPPAGDSGGGSGGH